MAATDERPNGYLKLARKAMDARDPLWTDKPLGRWRARLDLIALASFGRRRLRIRGQDITLHRGELFGSQAYFAKRWGWSVKKARLFLALLVDRQFMEERGRLPAGTVYRIKNYNDYQGEGTAT